MPNPQATEQLAVEAARLALTLEQRMRETEHALFRRAQCTTESQYLIAPQEAKRQHQERVRNARQANWAAPTPQGSPHNVAYHAILWVAYNDAQLAQEFRPLLHQQIEAGTANPEHHGAACLHCRISVHRDNRNATISLRIDPLAYQGYGTLVEAELIRLISATGRVLQGTAPMGAGARRLRQALGPNWAAEA